MGSLIGDLIYRERLRLKITQDQFGEQYQVTGPAVFKFEKGGINPSFKLWMRMAKDFGLDEPDAVVLWCKCKLAPEMQHLISREGSRADILKKHRLKTPSFSQHSSPEVLRKALVGAKNIPAGLKSLARDKDVWAVYRPTGREIDRLLACFGPYGDSTKGRWLEALRVLRMFAEK